MTVVLYGRSSTGKTTLACTFPPPLLLLNIRDDGDDSVSDVKRLKVKDIETFEDFEDTYWFLKENPDKFGTIIVDTTSQLQTMVVQESAAKKKKDVAKAGDWGTMSKKDWGDVAAVMKEWLVNYRDLSRLGMNVVFIAQDRAFNFDSEELDEGGEALAPEIGPALSPAVAKTLNAAVGVIGNTFIRTREIKKEVRGKKVTREKMEYCLRIGPSPVYTTKVRKPRDIEAPAFIVNPDYEAILEVINGE